MINGAQTAELQAIEQSASDLRQQAERFAVFELREADLAARQEAAAQALAGRIDFGRVVEEISLVLPEEVWLGQIDLHASTQTGQSETDQPERFIGWAPDPAGAALSDGYKSVASTLVRLASLRDSLTDVWLSRAEVETFDDFQGLAEGSSVRAVPVVKFEIEAQLKTPGSARSGQQVSR